MSRSGSGFQPEPLQPVRDVSRPQPSAQRATHGAAELPPSAAAQNSRSSARDLWTLFAAAAATLAITYALLVPSSMDETNSANWKYVQLARQSAQAGNPVQWRTRGGSVLPMAGIMIGQQDRAPETTQRVREALAVGDLKLADQLIFRAHEVNSLPSPVVTAQPPVASPDASATAFPEPPQATLSEGMRAEIERGDIEFYHIYLYDSCYEDGDVVEILIDGQPMFLVPIGNKGATVTVPIASNRTTVISVRGVYDGGGGITVGCRTSQGDGFVRSMAPEEIQPLSVVFPK